MKYLWMSFVVDDDANIVESVMKTHILGINPGGQVSGFEIDMCI